jgi:hypothetical protein
MAPTADGPDTKTQRGAAAARGGRAGAPAAEWSEGIASIRNHPLRKKRSFARRRPTCHGLGVVGVGVGVRVRVLVRIGVGVFIRGHPGLSGAEGLEPEGPGTREREGSPSQCESLSL